MEEGTRLNKFLASCGIGSRRACDKLVQDGHVEINGQPCLNPATKVLSEDFVKVDGRRMKPKLTGVVMLNKPRGLVCSKDDDLGRDTIFALLPGSLQHLNHAGRLDRDSEGLLVLTNDGTLIQNLLHPSRHVEKEYLVTSNQPVADEHLAEFLAGVYTEEGRLSAKEVERLSPRRVRVVLVTGHKRQVRVMFQKFGYNVQRLIRIRIGSFVLHDIPPGRWRYLEQKEIELLLTNPVVKALRPKARTQADKKTAAKKQTRRGPGGSGSAGSTRRKHTGPSDKAGSRRPSGGKRSESGGRGENRKRGDKPGTKRNNTGQKRKF